jgi:hypothetical protein
MVPAGPQMPIAELRRLMARTHSNGIYEGKTLPFVSTRSTPFCPAAAWRAALSAVRLVGKRYVDAMPYKDSKYLFVNADGMRIDVASIKQTVDLAAQRSDLSQNLWGDLGATFSTAVHSDPEIDGAALVLTRKGLAAHGLDDDNKPPFERLQECLQHHPLAPYGDISFFHVDDPTSRLYHRIKECWKRRDLTDDTKRTLRKTELREAIDLHRRGLVAHAIMARYFGLGTKQLRHWCNQFKRTGKISLVGNRTGMMTEEWRNKVVTLSGDRPITETHGEFHAYLVKEHDFPWKKGSLSTYLRSIGYRSEHRYRKVEIAFGDLIECEYSKLSGPPRLSSFHRLLQSKGFSFGATQLRNYMKAHGLKYESKKYARDWQQQVVAVAQAMRPRTYRKLHAFVKKKHKYPLSIIAMTRSLRAAGIELSTRAQGGRRFGPDSARAARRHGPGATAAKP